MLTMDAVCDTATGTTGLEISANINFRIIFLGSKIKKILNDEEVKTIKKKQLKHFLLQIIS